jgi:hypothetical protein
MKRFLMDTDEVACVIVVLRPALDADNLFARSLYYSSSRADPAANTGEKTLTSSSTREKTLSSSSCT